MKKNYRTKNKDFIMNYLESHSDSRVSAQDLYDAMTAQNFKVNLATVYRQLERLSDDGTVLKIKSSADDRHYYQFTGEHDDCSHHLHMQCSCCGKIIHLECHFMDSISDHLLTHHGFKLNCADSLLMGLCAHCQEQVNA
ncbi:MAG: transcriptional repressor [Erysipelotrichaceae bacterium]|nr:transcriptional repressor [Erysipelotrichaceae bacterium]